MATISELERSNKRRDLQTGRLETKIRLIEDRTNQFLDLLGNIQLQVGAGATVGGSYLTVNTEANLPYHRQIVWGDGINATDGGPGSTLTADVVLAANSGLQFATGLLQLGTPTTLNTTSTNSVTTATHSHDITTTADGAANASTILQSGTSGELALFRLFVDDRIMHDDDPNTYLEFTVDQANFTVGGLSMLTLTETTQDLITLGPGSGDVDIDFNGDMFLLGSSGFFAIGNTSPLDPLHISQLEPTIRLSDTDAVADTNVSATIEWWRGENTSRVAWLGPNSGDLSVSNEMTSGSILYRVNGNEFESFIMDENGRFGVNTLTPGAAIDTRSGTQATIRVSESATIYGQISHVAASNAMLIETTDGDIRFKVAGSSLDSLIVDSATLNVIVNNGQGSANFLVKGDGNDSLFYVDAVNDRVGIGTTVIPHGGIGAAKLAIEGANASAPNGPHMQFTTSLDDYPLLQILPFTHDNIILSFDTYFDGAFKSSDIGSNSQIRKVGDRLRFQYSSGNSQGAAVTWADAMAVDLTNGEVGIGTITPRGRIHGYDTISGFLHWEFDGLDGTSRVVIPGGTGDVLYTASYLISLRDSAGNVLGSFGTTPNNGFTDFNTGANTVRVSITAAGEMSVARVSGAGTIKVALWVIWL